MEQIFIADQTFDRKDFSKESFQKGDYEFCVFLNCNFSNVDLSKARFVECEFQGCNLSSVKLRGAAFQDVLFKDCKMLGMHFEHCSDFAFFIKIDHCALSYASFYGKKLSNTPFVDSNLQEVDFTGCDLNNSIFEDCDLQGAIFKDANLEKTDFRSSYNFSIDPEENRMKGAKFSLQTVGGLLDKHHLKLES